MMLRWLKGIYRLPTALLPSAGLISVLSFNVLDGDQRLTLNVEMKLGIPGNDVAQVYWVRAGPGEGSPESVNWRDAGAFAVHPGWGVYQIRVRADLRAVRIDPVSQAGEIAFRKIAFTTAHIPLRQWDARRGFRGWMAPTDLTAVRLRDGALHARSTGPDPQIVHWGLEGLAKQRMRIHIALAVLAGALWAGTQAILLLLVVRRASSPVARDGRAGPPSGEPRPRATAALALAFTLASSGAAYFVYRRYLSRPAEPRAPVADLGYEMTLVDRWGRPLSEKPGSLKLVIDPFTLYRNFPGQRTPHFTINERGWRGEMTTDVGAPRAVILGGSVAFGQGLASDDETFVAHLNRMSPGHQFVDAGVVGFLSGQELAEMVHYADALRPTLYIVLDGWNEVYAQLFPDAAAYEFGYNSPVFGLLEERLYSYATQQLSPESINQKAYLARPRWGDAALQERIAEAYLQNLSRMAAFAEARGAGFLVVFQPQLSDKRHMTADEAAILEAWHVAYPGTHPDLTRRYERLVATARDFCTAKGISCLDLNPIFRDDPRTLFVDAIHPNVEGHRLIAEHVRARLEAPRSPTSNSP